MIWSLYRKGPIMKPSKQLLSRRLVVKGGLIGGALATVGIACDSEKTPGGESGTGGSMDAASGSGGLGRGGGGSNGNGGMGAGGTKPEGAGGAGTGGTSGAGGNRDGSSSNGADAGRVDVGGSGTGPGDAAATAVKPGAIFDTHIHLWDLDRMPSFSDMKTRLPAEYKKKADEAGITGAVVVESVWNKLEENLWGNKLAEDNNVLVAIIGNVPNNAMFKDNLDMVTKSKYFRGIRTSMSTLMSAPAVKALSDKGLVVDLNVSGASSLGMLAMVAGTVPDLKIVVDHVAGGDFSKGFSMMETMALAAVAKNPNVYCKISRFHEQAGVKPAPTDPQHYKKMLDIMWETFGPDRLMFGTNWPLSEAAGTLTEAVTIMKGYAAGLKPDDAAKFFAGNARKFFGFDPR